MRIVISENELRAIVAGRPVFTSFGHDLGTVEIVLSVRARPGYGRTRVPPDPPQAREFLPRRRARR